MKISIKLYNAVSFGSTKGHILENFEMPLTIRDYSENSNWQNIKVKLYKLYSLFLWIDFNWLKAAGAAELLHWDSVLLATYNDRVLTIFIFTSYNAYIYKYIYIYIYIYYDYMYIYIYVYIYQII